MKSCDQFVLEVNKLQDIQMAECLELLAKASEDLKDKPDFGQWCRVLLATRLEQNLERARKDYPDPEFLIGYEIVIRAENEALSIFVDSSLHFSDFGFATFATCAQNIAAKLRVNGGAR